MLKSLKVGDSVTLEGKTYTVTHSWPEHRRFDIAKRCIRMTTPQGDIWAGYQDVLEAKLNGTFKTRETLNEVLGSADSDWDGHIPGACSCPGGC